MRRFLVFVQLVTVLERHVAAITRGWLADAVLGQHVVRQTVLVDVRAITALTLVLQRKRGNGYHMATSHTLTTLRFVKNVRYFGDVIQAKMTLAR